MKTFNEIIGYEREKKELYKIIDMYQNKDLYEERGAKLPKGILIYGGPGLGKTTLAEAFIKECCVETFSVKNKMLNSELIKEINNAFESASKLDKAIIFLDDMDKYSEGNENSDDRVFVTIQSNIDSVKDKDIMVIATVNNIEKLPGSLIRNGRFDHRIRLEPPTNKDARDIIEHYLQMRKVSDYLNIEDVSRMINYVSCADLETIINKSSIIATFNRHDSIEIDDIVKAYTNDDYNEFGNIELKCTQEEKEELEKTALHEAGHVVVAEALRLGSVGFVSIKKDEKNNMSGFTHIYEEFKRRPHHILISLAGKVACEQFYEGRCASGCQSDLQKVVALLKGGIYGSGSSGMGFLDSSGSRVNKEISESLLSRSEAVIQAELERYQFRVRDILLKNKEFLFRIAEELKAKGYLVYSDIKRIRNEETVTHYDE